MVIDSVGPAKKRTSLVYLLFSLLVSVGFFVYLFSTISLTEVVDVFRGISFQYVAVFVVFSFSMSLCRTWRYSLAIEAAGYQSITIALFLVTLVRNFFSDLLPARLGTLVYIYLVQTRLGLPFGIAAASFALSFIFDILTLGFLIIPAALLISTEYISYHMAVAAGVVLAVASCLTLLYLPSLLGVTSRLILALPLLKKKYRQKFSTLLTETRKDIEATRGQSIFWKMFFLSLGVRCYKYLSLYALLLALVIPLGFTVQSFPLAKVFLGLCSAELAASLPISGIAGFGAYEGAWTLVFQFFGYSKQIALLTSVSHHLFTQVYGYVLGALSLLLLLHPYFQGCFQKITALDPLANRKAWGKIIGSLVLLLLSLFFLLPAQNVQQQLNSIVQKGDHRTGGAGAAIPETVTGKVVYQRDGGLYVSQIGQPEVRRLVKQGTYPRWSPNGRFIAYVENNNIMLISEQGGAPEILASAAKARALCFSPDGNAVLFTDDKTLRRVDVSDHTVTTLLDGVELLEIDVADNPTRLAATVRTIFGYKVYVFDLQSGVQRVVANGCSASLSPDGSMVTVNGATHRTLSLYHWDSLQRVGEIPAPAGEKFDNQLWSNSSNWLSSVTEKSGDVYMHHVSGNSQYRLSWEGNCERADLFISKE